jgi:spore cortex biosynthesis protein YabQ
MSTADALWAGAVMALAGMVLGLMATVYGAERAVWRFGRMTGAVADWLWWVLATAVLLVGLFVADWGQLRGWALVTAAIGFLGWWWLAHPLLDRVCRAIATGLSRVWGIMVWPFRMAVRGMDKLRKGVVHVGAMSLTRWRRPKSPPPD